MKVGAELSSVLVALVENKKILLNKKGQVELVEFVANCPSLPDDDMSAIIELKMEDLLPQFSNLGIRFIDFDIFAQFGKYPRNPNNLDVTCFLEDIDRNNSLLIFISHCWLRGHRETKGWDGQNHPDNANGDKYKLTVAGIQYLKDKLAPRMKKCYVWLDFACTDQDAESLTHDLQRYDKIVECCDAIFTPIFDANHMDWELPPTIKSMIDEYKAPLWNSGPDAYLNRGWCRAEMLYAANIPILENDNEISRHTMFDAGLAFQCSQNRRPHFLYGSKEHTGMLPPITLPPLQHSYLTNYHPLLGNLTVASDIQHIWTLLQELQPYMDQNTLCPGYAGEHNEEGEKHGKGKEILEGGDVYTGEFRHDKFHGFGIVQKITGDIYEGNHEDGQRSGQGTYRYASGDVYVGEWKTGATHGQGCFYFASGNVYEGQFENGERQGRGMFRYTTGGVYDGEWMSGRFCGQGVYRYATGNVYEGLWNNGERCGDWLEGLTHGFGVFRYASGTVYEGEWKWGKKHGNGVYRSANGSVYEGNWQNDCMHGNGTYRYANGNIYEGQFHNDQMEGYGRLLNSELVVIQEGQWTSNMLTN